MSNRSFPCPHQLSRAASISRLNKFVDCIERSSNPAFIITIGSPGDEQATATPIGPLALNLDRMCSFVISVEDALLSETQWLFREACQSAGIEFSPLVGMTCLDESKRRYLSSEEAMSLLATRIRSRLHSQG